MSADDRLAEMASRLGLSPSDLARLATAEPRTDDEMRDMAKRIEDAKRASLPGSLVDGFALRTEDERALWRSVCAAAISGGLSNPHIKADDAVQAYRKRQDATQDRAPEVP